MICPSCGAEFADWARKCPYCGTVNEHVDEELYMEHLEELRNRLDRVDEESEEAYRENVKSSAGRIGKILLLIFLASVLVAAGVFWYQAAANRRYEKEMAAVREWERKEFPKLDALYEKGEYDSLLREFDAYLMDRDTPSNMYGWSHFTFVNDYYGAVRDIRAVREDLRAKKEIDVLDAGCALEGALLLWCETDENRIRDLMVSYRANNGKYGLSEEECRKVEEYRGEADDFLHQTLSLSDEEISRLYEDCLDNGFLGLGKCMDEAIRLIEGVTK